MYALELDEEGAEAHLDSILTREPAAAA
jgi:hypothetical protein